MVAEPVAFLDIDTAAKYAAMDGENPEAAMLLGWMADRRSSVQSEMDRFAKLCDRWDNLYYPTTVLDHAGASHWADHISATTQGMTHISLNTPPVYVDLPAALQSEEPVENMVAVSSTDEGRQRAAMAERLYFAWKLEEQTELKGHKASVVSKLYGRTAGKLYWDADLGRPCLRIVDQPRNLYLGWGTSDYTRLDWALYSYRASAEAVYEDWGLEVAAMKQDSGTIIPFVKGYGNHDYPATGQTIGRTWLGQLGLEVEVNDYWYRKPVPSKRRKTGSAYKGIKHETWNAIFVGNVMVKNEVHREYDGKMPYVPLFNGYVPGLPDGKPELYDIESLILQKDEQMTDLGQLLHKTVNGQLWQLTGPEAPDTVSPNVKPKPNKVVAPGAGNRIEAITPWMPTFQAEEGLTRLDREMADVTGLNDMLRGLAPDRVLSSSKAISALVSNYEKRLRMKRDLYYIWRRECWELAASVWVDKQPWLRDILVGQSRLDTIPASLMPRDDFEAAQMANMLVGGKLWAQKRGMDRVGVDDPEAESDIIREERTDATMFPADVQVMAQLMAVLQQLGYAPPPGAQNMAMSQAQTLADQRAALGAGQGGAPSANDQNQPQLPPEGQPANTPEGQQLTGPVAGGSSKLQTMTQGGEASGRLLTNTPLSGGGGGY